MSRDLRPGGNMHYYDQFWIQPKSSHTILKQYVRTVRIGVNSPPKESKVSKIQNQGDDSDSLFGSYGIMY